MKGQWFFFSLFTLAILAAWSRSADHYQDDWFEFDYPAGWQIREGSTGQVKVVELRSPGAQEMCLAGVEPTWTGIDNNSGHERRVATVLAEYPGLSRRGSPTDKLRPAGIERKSVLSDSDGNLSWISTLLAAGALVTVTCSTPTGYEQAAETIFQSLHAGRPGRLRLTEPDSTAAASSLVGSWDAGQSTLVFRRNGSVTNTPHTVDHPDQLYGNPQQGKYTVERGVLHIALSGEGVHAPVCVFRPEKDRIRLYCLGWSDEATYLRRWNPAEEASIVGALGLVLLSAVTLTLLFCFVSVHRFQKAVSTLMNQPSIRDDASDFRDTEPVRTRDADRHGLLLDRARIARRRLFAVYLVAGVSAASCLAVGSVFEHLTAFQLFAMYPIVGWPVALIAREVLGLSSRHWRYVVAVYFGSLLLLGLGLHIVNREFRLWDIVYLWALVNGFPTVVYYVLASKKVRTIGPLVFLLATIAMAGMWGLAHVAGTNMRVMSILEGATGWVRMSPEVFVFTVDAIGVLLSLPLLYLAFRAVARAYERRWFSEQSLIIASIWMLFAVIQAIVAAADEKVGAGELWTVCAIPCYFAVKAAAFRLLRRPESAPALLVLRAFALGRKSERVFDAVGGLWRFVGPVYLIGGADLASRLIQPSTLLRFAVRRLSSIFVDSHSTLRNRLANLSHGPDPDGRFRVEEFFCYSNTWEMTVRQLALRSGAILMDFRTFSISRSGCEREMRELLPIIPMERIVLVVDDDTDRTHLSEIIDDVLGTLEQSSPNYMATEASLSRVKLGRQDARSIETVCEAVFQLA
jgi:hypothetical protein